VIVFDLECRPGAHRFEGWFGSSDDFADQQARGLVACPHCGSSDVIKAVMAPAVGRKGNQAAKRSAAAPQDLAQPAPLPPEAKQALEALATLQAEALKGSRWVGKGFAEQSRAMHYGERDVETIHGQATVEEARELVDEGIAVTPLLFPVVPPDQAN
jgi:hypothetical protein